ncbi:MAG: hypothetical protein AAB739_00625 [Patescibacteria group bacterium]
MMNSFYGTVPYMWHLHGLFALSLLFGIVLLLARLVKEGKREKIMLYAWITIIIGILGILLTSNWGFAGMQTMMNSWK